MYASNDRWAAAAIALSVLQSIASKTCVRCEWNTVCYHLHIILSVHTPLGLACRQGVFCVPAYNNDKGSLDSARCTLTHLRTFRAGSEHRLVSWCTCSGGGGIAEAIFDSRVRAQLQRVPFLYGVSCAAKSVTALCSRPSPHFLTTVQWPCAGHRLGF